MGIRINTFTGERTPTCSICGTALCWGISEEEYEERSVFWDNWLCMYCVDEIPAIMTTPKNWRDLRDGKDVTTATIPFTHDELERFSMGYAKIYYNVDQKEKLIKPISVTRDGDIIKIRVGVR